MKANNYFDEREKLNKIELIKMALNKELLSQLERICIFANGNKGAINPDSNEMYNYNQHAESIILDIYSVIKDYDKCIKSLKNAIR